MEHRTPRQDKVLAGFRVSGVSKFGGLHESEEVHGDPGNGHNSYA